MSDTRKLVVIPVGPRGLPGPKGETGAPPSPAAIASAVAEYRSGSVEYSVPFSLTLAEHANRIVAVNPGGAATINWNDTGDGFSCLLVNDTTIDIYPTLVGFDAVRPDGMGGIVAGQAATVLCWERANGDRELWLFGLVVG